MQEDTQFMNTGVTVQFRPADLARLPGEHLALALLVVDRGGFVLARHDLVHHGGVGVRGYVGGCGEVRAVGVDGVWEFGLAHAGETVDDFGVAVGGGVVLA